MTPKTILITGASSGLGKALALGYASLGANLILMARRREMLEAVAAEARLAGAASVELLVADVVEEFLLPSYDIDIVIANAGISGGTNGGSESLAQINKIFATNVNGVINIITPIIADWKIKKQKGKIAIISSQAGFQGLPSSPAYSASKAAVRIYGEALRASLASDGISVTVVCPGYIKTPMTDINRFYMPFLMNAEKAATIIIDAIANGKRQLIFPLKLYYTIQLLKFLPVAIRDQFLASLPKKESL